MNPLTKQPSDPGSGLPCDVTTFVGRADELRALQQVLGSSRLVTLTGPGGVGKSRLALALARRHSRAFRDGVWFVALDTVTDPELAGHAVSAALHLPVPSTHDPEEVLREHLRHRRALLVLDNCEHLVEAAGRLIASLLRVAPELRVLATSRIPLGLAGEHSWPVPPLGVAGDDATGEPTEALALLLDRAAASSPGLVLDDSNRAAAEDLCRKLEGLPLAIELAATRLRVMSVEQLLHALDHRYDVLRNGPADAPRRHRSLRAAVEWSYELCSPREQELWMQLSVLPGSFDLDAAASLADGRSPIEVLSALEALTAMSVLTSEHARGTVRFRMLETLREFGRERLAESGERDALMRRVCAHYLALAERAAEQNHGSGQAAWLLRMRDERPNLWLALDVALNQPDSSTDALRMCGALWFLWVSGATGEGRHWLDRALRANVAPSVDRARALWTAGYVALTAGDLQEAASLFAQCQELARDLADEALAAQAAQLLGVTHMFADDLPSAIALLETSVGYFERTAERHPATIIAIGQLGVALVLAGPADEGLALATTGVEAATASGDLWCRSWALWLLACSSWFGQDLPAAKAATERALRAKADLDDDVGIAACLELAACIAQTEGDPDLSARLGGAARRLWRSTGGNRLFGWTAVLRDSEACERTARAEVGHRRYEAAADRGARLSTVEAVELALGGDDDARPPAPDAAEAGPLTAREFEVATLIARGMTNRQVAAELVISERTAESHAEHIRGKLGMNSRGQIAAWMLSRER
ncbi:ATP-binding protein [Baekduia sp.]|uniref:ATP-binding protein n=1 Tax=Baekduia sp. TaxID=2600305 RepID=UPI002D78493C|nr:LuxR C-terminal-related transcriptional regulator [Baekduia sp.]